MRAPTFIASPMRVYSCRSSEPVAPAVTSPVFSPMPNFNVGARIQDLNKTFPDYGILLSEFTLTALGPKAVGYQFADLGEAEIRGKNRAVRVFGLSGRKE